MAILIDPPYWPAHGRLWSHLVSDTSVAELHAFADRLGVPRRGFEGDHYDVPQEQYDRLVAGGAVPVSGRELLLALQRSGLRRPKRKGERVLGSTADDAGRRVDTLASTLPPLVSVDLVRLLLIREGEVLLGPGAGGVPSVAAAGRPVTEAARELVRTMLGTPIRPDDVAAPHLAQVGLIRTVAEGVGVIALDVVLRLILDRVEGALGGRQTAAEPDVRWVPLARAGTEVDPTLAPLVDWLADRA